MRDPPRPGVPLSTAHEACRPGPGSHHARRSRGAQARSLGRATHSQWRKRWRRSRPRTRWQHAALCGAPDRELQGYRAEWAALPGAVPDSGDPELPRRAARPGDASARDARDRLAEGDRDQGTGRSRTWARRSRLRALAGSAVALTRTSVIWSRRPAAARRTLDADDRGPRLLDAPAPACALPTARCSRTAGSISVASSRLGHSPTWALAGFKRCCSIRSTAGRYSDALRRAAPSTDALATWAPSSDAAQVAHRPVLPRQPGDARGWSRAPARRGPGSESPPELSDGRPQLVAFLRTLPGGVATEWLAPPPAEHVALAPWWRGWRSEPATDLVSRRRFCAKPFEGGHRTAGPFR